MRKIILTISLAAIVVIGAWIYWAFHSVQIAHWALNSIYIPEQAGPWGDSFGAYNALFGALGATAVVGTLLLQGRALRLQQEDQHRQRFEANFFQLLGVIRENRRDVRFANSEKYLLANPKAKDQVKREHFAFRAAYREMRYAIIGALRQKQDITVEELAKLYAENVHVRYESTLGAYFRLVYETLDRVERDDRLTYEEKNEFGNLVRGQMTSFEVAIAGCNALNDFAKDFKRLIIRFRLLKYAKKGEVYDELLKHYPPETFQGRETNRAPDPESVEDVDDDNGWDE
ncbi:Putative phage abortive infection protein [Rhizobium sp. AN5]|nr:Putative phage abortive infection protein [Rhizobium sp. AN5]